MMLTTSSSLRSPRIAAPHQARTASQQLTRSAARGLHSTPVAHGVSDYTPSFCENRQCPLKSNICSHPPITGYAGSLVQNDDGRL